MRYFELKELKGEDYEVLDEEVSAGTRPRYVLRHKVSLHRYFLKTYSKNPRELWAEAFASKFGVELGVGVQVATPKILPKALEDVFNRDYGKQLPPKWDPLGILVKDVFPRNHDQVSGKELLRGTQPGAEYFGLSDVESEMRGEYYASDDLLETFASMIVYDFLIGNMDRHHENWALLQKSDALRQLLLFKDKDGVQKLIASRKFCPLFDHGGSLMYELEESQVKYYLTHLDKFVESYIIDGCKTYFTYDGNKIPAAKLIAMHIIYLNDVWGKRFRQFIEDKVSKLDQLRVSQIIIQMPVDAPLQYSQDRKKLLDYSISKRCDILQNIIHKGSML